MDHEFIMNNTDNETPSLKILHTSDLHFLGDDDENNTVENKFPIIVNAAEKLNVDLLILAGDIFDTHRAPVQQVLELIDQINSMNKPCIILPGNHDGRIFDQVPDEKIGNNLFMIREESGEIFKIPSLDLSIWGKPTYKHTPEFKPLDGIPQRPESKWFIVVAHGLVLDSPHFADRSSLIHYEELQKADCDYIALGHVDVFKEVTQGKSTAYYCGAPWGPVTPPTIAIVSLYDEKNIKVEPITVPLSP